MISYIGIGSNLGDRKKYIKKAIQKLKETAGIKVKKISNIYETEPVGGPKQGKYLNGVIQVETALKPQELLTGLKRIERSLGRKRLIRNGPRTIDLDILLYGDKKINERDLNVPHPRMDEREFVLKPLKEIFEKR